MSNRPRIVVAMQLAGAEIGVLAVAGFAVLVCVLWVLRMRRATARRVIALATRVGDDRVELEAKGGLERGLSRLERVAGTVVARLGDARLAHDRLRITLAHVPQGVVVCDDTGYIVFRNENAAPILDSSDSGPMVNDTIRRLLDAAAAGKSEVESIELYGPPRRTLTISSYPLENDWRAIGGVAVIEDVSDRLRLEAVRRDFVANISHELKTPIGALGILAETLGGESDTEVVHRLAGRIQGEAQRVARIMDDLLDLSRIESEEAPVREPVPIHLIVSQAADRVRAAADQRSIRIRLGEPPHHLTVVGDRRQLVSAMYNLMENAVKYSDEGSSVEIGGRTDGEWIELRVIDHGIGIPAHDLERVFERFYRVDRARGRDTGGTGLGLSIVRHIAHNHGGDVKVDSTEGAGSTFTLRLRSGPVLRGG